MAKRPEIAGPDEDPNVTIECSSPPCFMHEMEPHADPKDDDKKKPRRPKRSAPKP